jgi:hypothetical protein
MKSSKIKSVLQRAFDKRLARSILIWGAAGVGKSASIQQVADELDVPLIDLRLSQLEPVDLRGIPQVDKNGYTVFGRSVLLPSAELHGDRGILLVDEVTAADLSMRAAAFQLFHDRRIGDHCIPDGWLIVGASNREEDRSIVNRLEAPLANRFTHLTYDLDLAEWTSWAAQAGINPLITGFVNFRASYLHKFNSDRAAEPAWPSPRSWHAASDWIDLELDADAELEVILGCVGVEAGTEFEGYKRVVNDLPLMGDIESNPQGCALPNDPAAKYALASVLAYHIDKNNAEALCTYLTRMEPEFTLIGVDQIRAKDASLLANDAATAWLVGHGNAILAA